MSDLFGENRDDNQRDDSRPRIIFANLRRPGRPILSEAGYKVFTATTFSVWVLAVLIIWVFRVEVSLTKDIIVALAGSSVELAALSLAVLGILHELNKKDKFFKLGLFLVATLFAGVVLGGFFMALTWQPAFDVPQKITVILLAALGFVAVLQFNWKFTLQFIRIRWLRFIVLPARLSTARQKLGIVSPFVLPVVLILFPDLNRLTAVIVLFAGGLISLITLMGVTTIFLLRATEEPEPDDPFVAALRKRYETEVQSIIRFGELKARTLDAIKFLQEKSVQDVSKNHQAPSMISKASIVVRLRQMRIMDDERLLDRVLSALVSESVICREGYNDLYWIIPDKQIIEGCLQYLKDLAFICTEKDSIWHEKTDFLIEGYKFTSLCQWLAERAKLPESVTSGYMLPNVLDWFTAPDKYHTINWGQTYIFVSKSWQMPRSKWRETIKNCQERYGLHFDDMVLLNELPHTIDVKYTSDLREQSSEVIRILNEQIEMKATRNK